MREIPKLDLSRTLVVALTRGGVPLGRRIAQELQVPLEVLVVRKVTSPFHREYGYGAVVEDGFFWVDEVAAAGASATQAEIYARIEHEKRQIQSKVNIYRGGRTFPRITGKTVILVDDGLATGVTARVAVRFLRERGAERIILGVAVCSAESSTTMRPLVDDLCCLHQPELFGSVGQHFENFEPVSDEAVVKLLAS